MDLTQAVLAVLLLGHGLIHVSYLTPAPQTADGPPWPFYLDRSWLLTRMGVGADTMVAVGRALAMASVLGFVVAGLAVLIGVSWWLPVTIVASAVSLALLTIWFHWWLPIGIAIDVALIVTLATGTWAPLG